jgi:WD40 repeat protein
MKIERNALQEKVFPDLQAYCQSRGWTFQPIDLRWGVSREASLDQRTMQICLTEIARCQEVTVRPNFLVLLGDRYGWRPLPEEIPAHEWKALRPQLAADIRDELEGWYWLDENAVVQLPNGSGADDGMYVLQPRAAEFAEDKTWADVQQRLTRALRTAAAVAWPGDSDSRRLKYEASATDQEIQAGALTVSDAHEHVVAFFRSIETSEGTPLRLANWPAPDLEKLTNFIDLRGGSLDWDGLRRLDKLKEQLTKKIQRDGLHTRGAHPRLLTATATWRGDGISTDHLPELCTAVHSALLMLIDAQIDRYGETDADEERLGHKEFAKRRARDFTGREADLSVIASYLSDPQATAPLLIVGEPGTGKSALLARSALNRLPPNDAEDVLPTKERPAFIYRFIGATPGSSDVRTFLKGICEELGSLYGAEEPAPEEVEKLAETLRQRLACATADRPLVIFLDALDQLGAEALRSLFWLPRRLGPHVRLVCSAIPGTLVDELRRQLPKGCVHDLGAMSIADGMEVLNKWLTRSGRRLRDAQFETVIKGFQNGGNPLYLRLAFEAARLWRSYDTPPEIEPTILGLVNRLFVRLSAKPDHGELLVNRVLGFLTCSRNGLSESELLDLLAKDDAYWSDFNAPNVRKHDLPAVNGSTVRQVPIAIWSRLQADLEPYLSWRTAHGTKLMTFFHPTTFATVVRTRFLSTEGDQRNRHATMAAHFVEAARGRDSARPWQSESARGFAECIHHLVAAGDIDQAQVLLTDLVFLAGKVRHKLVFELQDDFKTTVRASPEAQSELDEERARLERAETWKQAITLYSQAWSKRQDRLAHDEHLSEPEPVLPEVIRSVTPWSQEQVEVKTERIRASPTSLDRLRGFSRFITSECYALLEFGARYGFVIQHAANRLWDDPVRNPAHDLIPRLHACTFLRRWGPQARYSADSALRRTLEGHQLEVTSLALAADGRRALSGSSDSTLRVWDLETGACLRTLQGHTGQILNVVVTPDWRRALSASEDRTLCIWDLETGECQRALKGNSVHVTSVAVSPDGRHAVLASSDQTLQVWDLEKGEHQRTLRGHTGHVTGVAMTPDGRRAASASDDRTLRVWDLETGACRHTLEGHRREVRSVALTADGGCVISGSYDGTLRVWDLETGVCRLTLEGHAMAVRSVAVTLDGRLAVSASDDQTLRVWDLETGVCRYALEGHTGPVMSVAVTPEGQSAVSGGNDRTLRVWNLETGSGRRSPQDYAGALQRVAVTMDADGRRTVTGDDVESIRDWFQKDAEGRRSATGHTAGVTSVAVTADGRTGVSASGEWTLQLRVWDLETAECRRTLVGHTGGISGVATTPDGRRALSGSQDQTLRLWDLETGECLCALQSPTSVLGVAITADGRRALSGSSDRTLRVWNLEKCACERTLEVNDYTDVAESVAATLTPDGRRAVSAGLDRKLRVWDLATGVCSHILEGHTDLVRDLAVTLNGRRAVSASWDKTLRVWDLETGRLLHVLCGHTDGVESVALTPRGHRALSASDDQTLRLWDLDTGESLRTLEGHKDQVLSVAVTPDGRRAISGSCDQTLRVWDLATGECLSTLVGHTARVLSVAVMADGLRAVSASDDQALRIWDVERGECLRTLAKQTMAIRSLTSIADGRLVLSASLDGTLRVWDFDAGKCLRTLKGHGGRLRSMGVSPDGRWAVSASNERTLRIWDLASGESRRSHEGPSLFRSVALTPDGSLAASASDERTLRFWDLETGRCRRTVEGHLGPVWSVAISINGRSAVSASVDQTLRVWDLETGACRHILKGHTGSVSSVALTADGRWAVSASVDQALRVWSLDTGECLGLVRGTAPWLSVACSAANKVVAGDATGQVAIYDLIRLG